MRHNLVGKEDKKTESVTEGEKADKTFGDRWKEWWRGCWERCVKRVTGTEGARAGWLVSETDDTNTHRWTDRWMVLKLHFLYENMSPSLSNEYSSVHITWLMRVSPVSLSPSCCVYFTYSPPSSPDDSTLIPRCHYVSVFASSISALLPSSDITAGIVLKHMGHLSKNSQCEAK